MGNVTNGSGSARIRIKWGNGLLWHHKYAMIMDLMASFFDAPILIWKL
jgi:hypothetical protein